MKYRIMIQSVDSASSLVSLVEGDIPLNAFYDPNDTTWKLVYLELARELGEDEEEGKEPVDEKAGEDKGRGEDEKKGVEVAPSKPESSAGL